MKYYLFGSDIQHSFSPLIHNTSFEFHNLNDDYKIYETNDIQEVITILQKNNTGGASITMPFKESIIPFLDEISDTAKTIGAVNTIIKKDNKLIGENTDWIGIQKPLQEAFDNKEVHKPRVLIFGAGGAARAACYTLQRMNITFEIYNRTFEKAEFLAQEFKGKALQNIEETTSNIIINTIPPQHTLIPKHLISQCKIAFDIVYKPYWTPFLNAFQKTSHIIHGIEMLLEQGYKQFELWSSKISPKEKIYIKVFQNL